MFLILNLFYISMFVVFLGFFDMGLFGMESEVWINVYCVYIMGKYILCFRMKDIYINLYYGERGLK